MPLVQISHLYVSPGHNYFGNHGKPAGTAETIERAELRCVAGRGVEGDRFFDYKPDYKGQITFFAKSVYEELCEKFNVRDRTTAVFRRNVIVDGVDLNTLIGQEFSLQGVQFLGTVECKPCYWMDLAFSPGAEEALKGRGGLRAKIIRSGTLSVAEDVVLTLGNETAQGVLPVSGLEI